MFFSRASGRRAATCASVSMPRRGSAGGLYGRPGQSKYCLRYANHKLAPLILFSSLAPQPGMLKHLLCKWRRECLHTLVYFLSTLQKDLILNDDRHAYAPQARLPLPGTLPFPYVVEPSPGRHTPRTPALSMKYSEMNRCFISSLVEHNLARRRMRAAAWRRVA